MCKCTPSIRTAYCGKLGCEWPGSKPEGARVPSRTIIDDAELAALRRDAGRYRWLRDNQTRPACRSYEPGPAEAMRIACDAYGDEWDAAIDSAMSPAAASGKGGGE